MNHKISTPIWALYWLMIVVIAFCIGCADTANEEKQTAEAEQHRERGESLRADGDYVGAIEAYSAALRLDPRMGYAFFGRGLAHYFRGDLAKAVEDLTQCIQIDPTLTPAIQQRGWVNYKLGQFEDAIADFERAIHVDPDDPDSYFYLARVYACASSSVTRDGAKAVEWAQKGLEISDANHWSYQSDIAAAYAEVGDFRQAVRHQTAALSMAPPGDARDRCQKELDQYKKEKPWRDSSVDREWPSD